MTTINVFIVCLYYYVRVNVLKKLKMHFAEKEYGLTFYT